MQRVISRQVKCCLLKVLMVLYNIDILAVFANDKCTGKHSLLHVEFRPHVEYANSVFPYKQGDIKELEKIQKRATKGVIDLRNWFRILSRNRFQIRRTNRLR